MLRAVSGGVLDILEGLCNVSRNGDIAALGLVFPLQGEADVELAAPV